MAQTSFEHMLMDRFADWCKQSNHDEAANAVLVPLKKMVSQAFLSKPKSIVALEAALDEQRSIDAPYDDLKDKRLETLLTRGLTLLRKLQSSSPSLAPTSSDGSFYFHSIEDELNSLNPLLHDYLDCQQQLDSPYVDKFVFKKRANSPAECPSNFNHIEFAVNDMLQPSDTRTFENGLLRGTCYNGSEYFDLTRYGDEDRDQQISTFLNNHSIETLGGLHQGRADGYNTVFTNYEIDTQSLNLEVSPAASKPNFSRKVHVYSIPPTHYNPLLTITDEAASISQMNEIYCLEDADNPDVHYMIREGKLISLNVEQLEKIRLELLDDEREDKHDPQYFYRERKYTPIFKTISKASLDLSQPSVEACYELKVIATRPDILKYTGPSNDASLDVEVKLSQARSEYQYKLYRDKFISVFEHELRYLECRTGNSSKLAWDRLNLDIAIKTLKNLDNTYQSHQLPDKIQKLYEVCNKVKANTHHALLARIINTVINRFKTFFGLKESTLGRPRVGVKTKEMIKYLERDNQLFFVYSEQAAPRTRGLKRAPSELNDTRPLKRSKPSPPSV